MKKTFLTKRNALLTSAGVSWGAVALMLAVLMLLVRLLAPNLFWRVFTPVFHTADTVAAGSHALFSSFGNTANLVLENEKLQNENAALASENQTLLQKTADQGVLLGAPAAGKNATAEILAGVVARPPESPYDTLVLAEGTSAGVAVGQEAFAGGGIPIGIVSSVISNFSRVTLFSSPGMTFTGWIGQAHTPVIIVGSGAGTMSASLARSAHVAVNDTVFGPGPGMLAIGSVVRIDSDPSSPSVTLRIRPVFNLFSVSWISLRDTGRALIGAFSEATSTLP